MMAAANPASEIATAALEMFVDDLFDSQREIAAQLSHARLARKAKLRIEGHTRAEWRRVRAGAAQPAAKMIPTSISFEQRRRSQCGNRADECTLEK